MAEQDNGWLRLEAALRKSEKRLHQVVESAPNAIVMIAATGVIEMVNAQTERMFGYSTNELLGQPIELLVPERYRRNHPRLRTSFFERPVSRWLGAGRDLFGLRKDGSEFPIEIGLNPIETDEGIMVLAAVVDISERKQKDERLRAAISKLAHMDRVATAGELSVSIAHEIRQPLTAIVANANAGVRWLTNNPPDLNQVRKCLEAVASSGLRAGEVVSGVLAMVKRDGCEQSPIDLNEVIQDVLEVLREELERLEIIVQTELITPPPLVLGHHGQLQQVVLNLVKNSADAMKSLSGHPRMLRVSSAVRNHSDVVHVSVQDSGEGIDPKDIERIFDPFFSTKSQGMGVGLSICRRIIEDHRGQIWASSGVDHGSIFHVQLPVFRGQVE